MRILSIKPVTFIIAVSLILLAGSLPQSYATPVEISYDNGTPATGISYWGGVRFSLPSGVLSAKLLTVEYYWNTFPTTVRIHITQADHMTEMTGSPIISVVSAIAFNDQDVSGLGIVVTGDFFVVLENIGTGGAVFDNSAPSGRSFYCMFSPCTLATLTNAISNNFLIRVVVDPIPATTTTTVPPPAVHPLNVGGEMFPVNMLRVVAPWVAAMLALTVIAVDALVIRRRKSRKA